MAEQLPVSSKPRAHLQARRTCLSGLALAVASSLLGACALAQPADARPTDVAVELDVFSGRPNPAWRLTEAEVSELWSRLLPAATSSGPPPSEALGYRGFSIHNPGVIRGLPERLYVSRGYVYALPERLAPQVYFEDGHGLEAWLQKLARDRGFGALLPP